VKFIINLDMPCTVTQMEEFCAQARRVHEAHPASENSIDDLLIKTWDDGSDEGYDTGGTCVVVDFEREV